MCDVSMWQWNATAASGMTAADNLARVWNRMVDLTAWNKWNSFVVKVEMEGAVAIGTPITLHMYDGTTSHEVITVLDLNKTFCYDFNEWEHKLGLMTTHRCYVFETGADNSVTVHSSLHIEGVLSSIVSWFKASYVENGIKMQNASLKASFGETLHVV